jgi:glycosyltransferase involved in cell wall biosynthesis
LSVDAVEPSVDERRPSVTVALCCHDSAARIEKTLQCVRAQRVPPGLAVEVLVIDNASADATTSVARATWGDGPFPLRVIAEPRLGLTFARLSALREARHDVLAFIDDDNWLDPDWLDVMSKVMQDHAEVGACGGAIEAAPESPPPWWLEGVQTSYAVGPQGAGDVTDQRGALYGAGLCVRLAAWRELEALGFGWLGSDRTGTQLLGCGDTELCLALRVAGWRLWVEPRMRMRHHIPTGRLTWDYVRRLHRGSGASTPALDPYQFVLTDRRRGYAPRLSSLRRRWTWQLLRSLLSLGRHVVQQPRALARDRAGSREALQLEECIGRVMGLWWQRRSYHVNVASVRALAARAR